MPELPEVDQFRKYINSTSLHQNISKVKITNEKILEENSKDEIENILIDNSIISTERIGKYLFLKLKNDNYLVLHFGMTGNIKYFKRNSEKPSHTRLLIRFSNNYQLAYDCQRLFGIINITTNVKDYIEKKKLGPDALSLKKTDFFNKINKRSSKIKSFLMDQKILSGIGNIYADEILFQSRIHPETRCNKLSKKQKEKIFSTITEVLQTAINHNAIIKNYPNSYLLPHRREDNKCPLNKNHDFKTIKISGRTTYYCPIHQK